MSFTVGIIGAGSIGALKPDNIDSQETSTSLTHAHAVYKNSNLHLKWIYDANKEQEKKACKKWNCWTLYPQKNAQVDVVVISSPTNTHLKYIENLCSGFVDDEAYLYKCKPKLIVLEKPAGNDIYECSRIDYLSKECGIPIIVHYNRRWCDKIKRAVQIIKKEGIQGIVLDYTRGFIRDGCHAIDMLNWLCGDFIDGKIINPKIEDNTKEDPTRGVILSYTNCELALLMPIDGRIYDVFEMNVMTKDGRWILSDHFNHWYKIRPNTEKVYGDYKSLPGADKHTTIHGITGLSDSLDNLYAYAVEYLSIPYSPFNPECGMSEALRVHSVFDRLFNKYYIENQKDRATNNELEVK